MLPLMKAGNRWRNWVNTQRSKTPNEQLVGGRSICLVIPGLICHTFELFLKIWLKMVLSQGTKPTMSGLILSKFLSCFWKLGSKWGPFLCVNLYFCYSLWLLFLVQSALLFYKKHWIIMEMVNQHPIAESYLAVLPLVTKLIWNGNRTIWGSNILLQ